MRIREMFNFKDMGYKEEVDTSVGSMIWVPRDKTSIKRKKLSPGHQEGPYIVLKEDENSVYALFCTSNSHSEIDSPYIYIKLNNRYNGSILNTSVYMREPEVIAKEDIVRTIDYIREDDMNYISKVLKIVGSCPEVKLKYYLGNGDILRDGNHFYYLYEYGEVSTLFELRRTDEKSSSTVTVYHEEYELDLSEKLFTNAVKSYELVGVASQEQREEMNKVIKAKEYSDIRKKSSKIGNIIYLDNSLYYIYGIDGKELMLFEIYIDKSSNMDVINIDGEEYYTSFLTRRVGSDFNIHSLGMASVYEENVIQRQYLQKRQHDRYKVRSRKHHILKRVTSKKLYGEFQPQFSMMNRETNKRYIILDRVDDDLIVWDIEEKAVTTITVTVDFPYYVETWIKQLDFDNYLLAYEKAKVKVMTQ